MYEVPTYSSWPYGVVTDKDDNFWMAEYRGCKLMKFNPVTEQFSEYSPLKAPCWMRRLSIDAGGMIWYGYYVLNTGKLGKLDPNTGKIVEYDLPMPYTAPYDVMPDSEGNLWLGDSWLTRGHHDPAALIKFEPRTEKFTFYPSPRGTDMPKIDVTKEGAVWYGTRAAEIKAVGVLYPDMTKIKMPSTHN